MVVGWMFSGVGCHATSKGAELSCELDYAISFWLWILSCKCPHFVEISTLRGYYPHFVYITVFCGNIHVLWILSAFCGNIHISWRLSAFCGNIHIPLMLSAFRPFYLSHFTYLVKVTVAFELFVFSFCLCDVSYIIPFPIDTIPPVWLLMSPYVAYKPSTHHLIILVSSVDNAKHSSSVRFRYANTLIRIFQYSSVGYLTLVFRKAIARCTSGLDIFHINNSPTVDL